MSKSALADAQLILDGRLEHRRSRALWLHRRLTLLLLCMVSLQLSGLLNVSLLLRDPEISSYILAD